MHLTIYGDPRTKKKSARVLEDDNSKIAAAHDGSRVEIDRENPRMEIEFEEMR